MMSELNETAEKLFVRRAARKSRWLWGNQPGSCADVPQLTSSNAQIRHERWSL